jgi:hypothetical protein
MPPKVKIVDRGWNKIKKNLAGLRAGKAAAVGVQGSNASKEHEGGGLTNALLATFHEYGGDPSPPERSFLRSTMSDRVNEYQKELDNIGRGFFEGGTVEGNLLLLGEKYKADIIDKIKSGIAPPLKEETLVRKKGEVTPLIGDTGQLINSFSVEVKDFDAVEHE